MHLSWAVTSLPKIGSSFEPQNLKPRPASDIFGCQELLYCFVLCAFAFFGVLLYDIIDTMFRFCLFCRSGKDTDSEHFSDEALLPLRGGCTGAPSTYIYLARPSPSLSSLEAL